jgi:hypothetical protein
MIYDMSKRVTVVVGGIVSYRIDRKKCWVATGKAEMLPEVGLSEDVPKGQCIISGGSYHGGL